MKPWFLLSVFAACCVLSACKEDGSGGGNDAGNDGSSQNEDSAVAEDSSAQEDSSTQQDSSTQDDANVADAGADGTMGDGSMQDAAMPPTVPSVAGQLVITEFIPKTVGYATDDLAEWIELYNPSDTVTYNLNTCVFGDKPGDDDYTFTADLLIPPHTYVVLTSSPSSVLTHGFVGDAVYGLDSGFSGSAGGDSPLLKCGGVVIDTVNYASTAQNMFPVGNDHAGYAFQLDPTHYDATANDTAANWCLATDVYVTPMAAMSDYGTPRAANRACNP